MASILTALIIGFLIGIPIGAKLGWRYAFMEMGRMELSNRINAVRNFRHRKRAGK